MKSKTLHSSYTCSGVCSALSSTELSRLKEGGKTLFKHSWLTNKDIAYSEETGLWWLIYIEEKGMFCLLCRIHNSSNKLNKQETFNLSASINFKQSAIKEHAISNTHKETYLKEMERRHSSLAAQYQSAKQARDTVTTNSFLSTYWLGKEEVANCKLKSLLELEEDLGLSEMKHFQQRSQRSQKNMRLLLGQLIKKKLISKVKDAKYYSILVDEVSDIAVMEQLLIYIGYVDVHGETHFDFLEIKDVLENSPSANAETITELIIEELKECGLPPQNLCGFGSDGASVMTGSKSGVGVRLKKTAVIMIRSHCINHRLALACGDTNDFVKYIQVVETTLKQVWKWLEYPKHSAAFVKACKITRKLDVEAGKKLDKKLSVKVQKACRTRWLSTGKAVASVGQHLVPLLQTFRDIQDNDATAAGLLQRMNNTKFVGTLLMLNKVLPHLNTLSKIFQKDHTCYSCLKPSLEYTKAMIQDIQTNYDVVKDLSDHVASDGPYAALELSGEKDPKIMHFLTTLVQSYSTELVKNLDNRFKEACPVFQAFSVFDPTCLPKSTDVQFLNYGDDHIKVICEQLQFNTDQALAQWSNFKYVMAGWRVPTHVLKGEDISPTAFILKKIVKEQAILKEAFHFIVDMATVCLCQPLSNAVVERGASAVKRIKTRLRSTLKNDMLSTLLHISINGPGRRSPECQEMLNEATKLWRQKHTRNLPSLKTLPRVGGKDYAEVNMPTLISTGTQVNLIEEKEDEEEGLMDKRVQVEGEGVASTKENLSRALFELGMDSDPEWEDSDNSEDD